MAVTSAAKAASTKHTKSASPAITIERARLLCPNFRIVENISAALGLSVPDFKGIREAHELALCRMSNSFGEELNERASQMQFQRLTGSLIAAAIRGGEFYSEKVTEVRDATSSLANDARDNDLEDPLVSKAGRSASALSPPKWRCKPTPSSPRPKGRLRRRRSRHASLPVRPN